MAEICLECLRILNEKREPRWKYILSEELDLCEGCGQWKRVIIRERFILIRRMLYALMDLAEKKRRGR